MGNTAIMDAGDAVYGSLAECFITIGKRRYNFMNLTEFESKWDVTISDVKILGKVGMGHKAAGGKGTWKGTAHYNQSVLRTMANQYQKTGNLPYFEIRQTIIHRGCLCDSFILAKFQAGEEILDEDISGTFERWDMPEKFKELEGFKTN